MQPSNEQLINTGKKCPYCNKSTRYIDSEAIYGTSYGMIYICGDCDAYVGVHKGTDNALGRLANKELRALRKQAHAAFDPIWKNRLIYKIHAKWTPNTNARKKAYMWLAYNLGLETDDCHIALFNKKQCEQTIELCTTAIRLSNK